MIPDIDIHRCAWLMIGRYGDDAALQAAIRGDAMPDKGDLDGMLVWVAVIRAIERLQAATPTDSERVH